ncbi:hypothetical protein QPK87_05930 [Kamptonema cortianum]|nr:hypothetical protein [Geitlerinema splendidum]MDK3156113.1 hypothetical protein [Kamptonema cortianum]
MISSLLMASALGVAQNQPADLSRKFTKGQTFAYEVRSHMIDEVKQGELAIGIPSEVDINYDFTYTISDVKPSGFATLHYKRPWLDEVQGETADRPPKTTRIKMDYNLELSLSPINEVTGVKDLNPPNKTGGGSLQSAKLARILKGAGVAPAQVDIVGQFSQELYRLALFIGPLDNSLDFNPKMPFEEAKIGDTWQRTVSYQPQTLKGSADNQQAMQRLDLTYVYDGIVESRGKKVHRVSASYKLDSDAALFINQMMRMKPSESGLEKFPLQIETKLIFDLDLQTRDTLYAESNTKGHWSLKVIGRNDPVVESDFKGKSILRMVSRK